MTVITLTSKIIYVGTATVSVFAYPFRIFVDTDLVVTEVLIATGVETVLTITTDYTISGAGDASGGNVTLVAGNLPATKKLVIQRTLPQTQAFDLEENDNAPSLGYENAYDRAVMLIQEIQTTLDSAMRLPIVTSGVSIILPEPEADKVLVWNTAADALTNQTLTQTDTGAIANGAVTTAKLAALAVTAAKLATDAVETAKIKNLAVTTGKIALLAIDTAQLAADAVDGSKIEDDAVNSEHIAAAAIDVEHLSTAVLQRTIKGMIQFTGTGTIAINDSFNVSGITDTNTGDYIVTWDVDFADGNYSFSISGADNFGYTTNSATAGALVVLSRTGGGSGGLTDSTPITVIASQ